MEGILTRKNIIGRKVQNYYRLFPEEFSIFYGKKKSEKVLKNKFEFGERIAEARQLVLYDNAF